MGVMVDYSFTLSYRALLLTPYDDCLQVFEHVHSYVLIFKPATVRSRDTAVAMIVFASA
jgi:hypothetical protein